MTVTMGIEKGLKGRELCEIASLDRMATWPLLWSRRIKSSEQLCEEVRSFPLTG